MKPAKSIIWACSLALLALPRALANDMGSGADAKFKAMDTDGDGRVSRAEHSAGARKMFDGMDANHDGVVSAPEMDAYQELKTERANPAPAKNENAIVPEKSSAEKIRAIDLDGDGQLTAAEHAAGSESMFSKMDTDGDGYLSAKEMAAGHAMMKKDK